ncbi:hypothetical protein Aconfl_21200 [Algoriphagus confluentis]|uniref:Uncharacterized protein n=1 Tax=Algoriphagus confluentis TaxID=1697556 RepID=A0ABQ6PNH2_9BACT|nr:hypothetical protein Aconfl_21200 [Algoriphagus confluentis]
MKNYSAFSRNPILFWLTYLVGEIRLGFIPYRIKVYLPNGFDSIACDDLFYLHLDLNRLFVSIDCGGLQDLLELLFPDFFIPLLFFISGDN